MMESLLSHAARTLPPVAVTFRVNSASREKRLERLGDNSFCSAGQ